MSACTARRAERPAAGEAGQPRQRRANPPSPATDTGSRWSPTSASLADARRPCRLWAARAWGCCARSSSSSTAAQRAHRGRADAASTPTSRGAGARAHRSSSERWTSAATSRCRTCRSAQEENPFLGERGVRVGLNRPEHAAHPDCGPSCARPRRQGRGHVPDDRDAERVARGQGDVGAGARRPRRGRDPGRVSWSRSRGGASWPSSSRARPTSSRSAQRSDPVHAGHGPGPSQAGTAGGWR